MMGRTIAVVGGAGYVGSHTSLEIAKRGIAPLVIDNLSTGSRELVKWGDFVNLDIRETDSLTKVLSRRSVDTVFHFAASAYVGESVRDPLKYYKNNVGGMLSLLTACSRAKVKSIVFSSSCATYGTPDHVPITEAAEQQPINPYGMTKLICERMLKDITQRYGMNFAILRYFNVAGADPNGALRECHDPETHLIPLAFLAAAGKTPPLRVFGTDYDTPDGSCIRDFIHVSDLARGHILALEHLGRTHSSLTVNLGSGSGASIFETLSMIQKVTGRKVPVRYGARRAGDPPVLVADTSLARDLLGFVPERSALSTIIEDAARSFGLGVANAVSA